MRAKLTGDEFSHGNIVKQYVGQVGEVVKVEPPVRIHYIVYLRFDDGRLWHTYSCFVEPLPGEPTLGEFLEAQRIQATREIDLQA